MTKSQAACILGICIVLGISITSHNVWGLDEKPVKTPGVVSMNKDYELVVDLKLLQSIPARRLEALRQTQDRGGSSGEEIARQEKYYQVLKSILAELQAAYYAHEDFPKDVAQGIDTVSLFQTSIRYPFYPTSGLTAFDGILVRTKIKIAEELIQEMARQICEASRERGIKVKGDAIFYDGWKWKWDYMR